MNSQSQVLTHAPRWRQVHRGNIAGTPPPRDVATWLLEPGSLTARLRHQFGPAFNIVLLGQSWQHPFTEESCSLGLKSGQRSIVREVCLQNGDVPLILARSIIPAKTLHGADRRLANLGTQPLGHVLFSDPRLKRLQLKITRLRCMTATNNSDHSTPSQKASLLITGHGDYAGSVWGRRSLYSLGAGHKLLVAEFFLPGLFNF